MKEKKEQLEKELVLAFNKQAGAINTMTFFNIVRSMLSFCYLSEAYEKKAQEELSLDLSKIPLEIWYDEHKEKVDDFESKMRSKLQYIVKPEDSWKKIVQFANKQKENLLERLEYSLKSIEQSFENSFKGLFSKNELYFFWLGDDNQERNKELCRMVEIINQSMLSESSLDNFGHVYESLIEQLTIQAGKSGGDFYTPQKISTILSKIISLDNQQPSIGKKKKLDKVFDFACGSGSSLLNVYKEMGKGAIGKVYGQEENITAYNIARMNMLLHGLKDSEFEIHHGDSLLNGWELLNENSSPKIEFDAVVAVPPFSYRWNPAEELENDLRFKNYGIAPKSAADFAFLLHGFHFLRQDGTMAIVLPHGVLFRGGKEGDIRKKLLKDGNIDAIIGLPSNLLYGTSIPFCILVLKKCRKEKDVLFINATSEENYIKDIRKNSLRDQDIHKITETYQYRRQVKRYSRCVSMDEIAENDYKLNISRYVSTDIEEEPVNLQEVNDELKTIEKEIEGARNRHNEFLKELGLPLI